MSKQGELLSTEKTLEGIIRSAEERLKEIRNEMDRDHECKINTCHRDKYDNDKCEPHYLKDKHSSKIADRYTDPVANIAMQLMEMNVDKWIPHKDNTLGADQIREEGLTSNQVRWLDRIQGRSEKGIQSLINDIESANEDDRNCPICNGLREHCSCAKALNKVIIEGLENE